MMTIAEQRKYDLEKHEREKIVVDTKAQQAIADRDAQIKTLECKIKGLEEEAMEIRNGSLNTVKNELHTQRVHLDLEAQKRRSNAIESISRAMEKEKWKELELLRDRPVEDHIRETNKQVKIALEEQREQLELQSSIKCQRIVEGVLERFREENVEGLLGRRKETLKNYETEINRLKMVIKKQTTEVRKLKESKLSQSRLSL